MILIRAILQFCGFSSKNLDEIAADRKAISATHLVPNFIDI